MKRKQIVDLITAVSLIIVGSLILIFPLLKIVNIKYIFMGVLSFYGIMNLIQFLLTNESKDYEGLFTMIASICTLILLGLVNIEKNPLNLALTLFFWVTLMSLIKLKKCYYYHDRKKKIYILRIITLVLFILTGLLCTINLYYETTMQVLVIGFFYFIHGILELFDPIVYYLIELPKKS